MAYTQTRSGRIFFCRRYNTIVLFCLFMVGLFRTYAGSRAKLLTEIRADGVEAGSAFSPRPPCCLLRLCHMFPQDGLGFFDNFWWDFYLLLGHMFSRGNVLAAAKLYVAAK